MGVPPLLRDALTPIIQAGIGRTREVLHKLSDATWQETSVSFESFASAISALSIHDEPDYGIYFNAGWATSIILFPKSSGLALARAYMFKHVDGGTDWLDRRDELMDKLGTDTVAEIGNILVHAMTNVWSDFHGVGMLLPAPRMFLDTMPNILKETINKSGTSMDDFKFAVTIHMTSQSLSTSFIIAFFLDSISADKLISSAR